MALRDRVNPHILELSPYQPGKPVEELERELGIQGSIKMASNENSLGPSPRAMEAVRAALEDVNRYPDGASYALRQKLAAARGLSPEQLVFGCGADELFELLAKTFLSPGDEVVYPWPSFAMYPVVVTGMGATPVPVPLDNSLVLDLPAMAKAVNSRTKIVMICNPNNPTGTSVGAEAFDAFVQELPPDVVLVVDEAYYEYVRRPDFPDALAWLEKRPGTIVLRTFSKIFGLAGLRIGYGMADAELASYLERARHPFNVNKLAEVAALAALDDSEHAERTRRVNAEGIEYLSSELEALGYRVWPTDANYVLIQAAADAYDKLLRQGVIVRPLRGFGLDDHVRVTVGTREENERIVAGFQRLKEEGP